MKIVMVTGASSGIGAEFVRQLDENFSRIDEIWMIARSRERMEAIAMGLKNKIRIFCLDLEQEESRKELEVILQLEKPGICMLVNCAGYGLMGPFEQIPLDEQLGMIELNCKALTAITYMALPFMVRNGRIIQLASSAAFVPQMNFAVYAATKSYVLSFSRALQEEIRSREIFVTAVCPGPVETPFFDRAGKYGKTLKSKENFCVSTVQVVKDALNASKKRKILSVCSLPMKAFHAACKFIPHDFMLEIIQHMYKEEAETREYDREEDPKSDKTAGGRNDES